MYVIGECRKCREVLVFDIEDRTVEQGKELMEKIDMRECPGFHIEIGTWADYYDFDWDNLYEDSSKALEVKNEILKKRDLEVV